MMIVVHFARFISNVHKLLDFEKQQIKFSKVFDFYIGGFDYSKFPIHVKYKYNGKYDNRKNNEQCLIWTYMKYMSTQAILNML